MATAHNTKLNRTRVLLSIAKTQEKKRAQEKKIQEKQRQTFEAERLAARLQKDADWKSWQDELRQYHRNMVAVNSRVASALELLVGLLKTAQQHSG